jgi:hypothetical protein
MPWLSTAEERDALAQRDLAGVRRERMAREKGEGTRTGYSETPDHVVAR